MAQDYNVEDILEEIRRKKGDGAARRPTYEKDISGTGFDTESEPSRRITRSEPTPDAPVVADSGNARAPRADSRPPARPEQGRRAQEPAAEPVRRQSEPVTEPVRRQNDPAAGLSPRAAERMRRGGEAYGNVAPLGSRRPDRRSAFAPRTSRENPEEETAVPFRQTSFDAPDETARPSRQTRFDAPDETARPSRQTRFEAPDETARPSRQTRFDAPDETAKPPRQMRFGVPDETAKPPRASKYGSPDEIEKEIRQSRYGAPAGGATEARRTRYDAPDDAASPPRQTRYDVPETTSRPPRQTRYDAPDALDSSKPAPQIQVAYDPLTTKPSRRQFDFDAPPETDEAPPRQQRATRDAVGETARPSRQTRFDAPDEAVKPPRASKYGSPDEVAKQLRQSRYGAPSDDAAQTRRTRYDAPDALDSSKPAPQIQVAYDPLTTKPSRRQFDFDAPPEIDEALPGQQRATRDAAGETARPSRQTRFDAPDEVAKPPRAARYGSPGEAAKETRQPRYGASVDDAAQTRRTRYDAPDALDSSKPAPQFQLAYDPLTTKPSRRQFDFDAPPETDEAPPRQQRPARNDAPDEAARLLRQTRYDAPDEAAQPQRQTRYDAPGIADQATGGFVLPTMEETAEMPFAPKINYSPAAGGFGPELGAVNGGGDGEAVRRRRPSRTDEPRGAGAEGGYTRRRSPLAQAQDAAEGGYVRRRPARSPNAPDDTLDMDGNPGTGTRPRRRVMRQEDEENGDIVRSRWQDSYNAQEELEDEPPEDDFGSPEDAPYVAKDIKAIQVGLNAKLFMMAVLSFLSIYLAMSVKAQPFAEALGVPNGLLALPELLLPEKHMQAFLIANIVIVALAAIVCSSIVGGGIAALCKLHANSDSPAALAVLGVLTQGVVLSVSPETVMQNDSVSLYFCVALVALIFNLIGKKLLIARVSRNFQFITTGDDMYALLEIRNRELSREFARGLGPDADRVAYSTRTDFLTGFLDKSYAPDYSESFSGIVVPITLFGAAAVAVVTYFLTGKNLPSAISSFAAVLCICSPFSSSVVPNQMLNAVSKKLTKNGAMLAGYESAEDYADIGSVIIDDTDLFYPENIMLHGMKVFAEKRIDDAILDAASVILSCGGIMSGVFLNMIGGNRGMLKKVDSLMYEDGMGLSAWVDGKRVLIGSNELMQHHGIDCPSRDFENRYVRDGRRVLYLANTGELTAMFVLSYNPAAETAEKLIELQRRGVGAIVYTTDPNVTGDLIASVFGIRRSGVRVLPAKMHPEHTLLVRPKERVRADGAHSGTLGGVISLLRASIDVKNSVTRGTIVQLVGLIVGYGLIAFMSFTGSLRLASYGTLLVYSLAWLVVTWAACAMKKK